MSKNTDLGNLVNGLFVSSTRNVGIGTTTPLLTATDRGNLTINGATSSIFTLGVANGYSAYFFADASKVELSTNAQPMTFVTNGVERMRITNGGNVGIGTGTPADGGVNYKILTLNGFNSGILRIQVNGADAGDFESDATNTYLWELRNANLSLGTNSTERVRILANGNVGIGTTTPNISSYTRALTVSASSGYAGMEVYGGGGTTGGQIDFGSGTTRFASISGEYQSATNGYLNIRTQRAGSMTDAVRIAANGSVGIGTNSPSHNLSVRGSNATDMISWTDAINNTGYLGIRGGGVVWMNADNNLVLATSNTERMRITSGGNVGIGTTGPSQRLEVSGTVLASSFLSASGLSYPAINTWTTFYTMAAERGIYSVIIGFSAGTEDISTWFAYGTLFTQGSAGTFSTLSNGSLVQLRASGLNLQVLLTPGASFTRELSYKILRT